VDNGTEHKAYGCFLMPETTARDAKKLSCPVVVTRKIVE
jgi:hypothetical protein